MASNNFDGTWWFSIPLTLNIDSLISIDENDLFYNSVVNKNNPIENHPHLTLLMGIPCPTENLELLMDLTTKTQAMSPLEIRISKLGYFSNDHITEGKYDVLFAEPDENKNLVELHNYLCNLFNVKWHFPSYHPHMTLGYLKSGAAQKYIDSFQNQTFKIQADKILLKKYRDKKENPIQFLFSSS